MARSPAALTNATNPVPPRSNVAVPASASRENATFEQLQQQLQDYGVTYQMLKTNGNGTWTFICSIPDPARSGQEDHFKAEATGPNGLAAIRAIFPEIEAHRRENGPR
jgi:hypothetical protein